MVGRPCGLFLSLSLSFIHSQVGLRRRKGEWCRAPVGGGHPIWRAPWSTGEGTWLHVLPSQLHRHGWAGEKCLAKAQERWFGLVVLEVGEGSQEHISRIDFPPVSNFYSLSPPTLLRPSEAGQ